MRSLLKKVLGDRSVAAWQVIGGVCAAVTLVVGCCSWGLSQVIQPDHRESIGSNSTAAHQPSTDSTSDKPTLPATRSPFIAREVTYLSTVKPTDETPGVWRDGPQTVDNVTYQRSIRGGRCRDDEERVYLIKKEWTRFRADVGLPDDAEIAGPADVYIKNESGTVIFKETVRAGRPVYLDVPIDGVLRLSIGVGASTYEMGCHSNHVVFADARLER
jgi:hypothetical protein